MRIFLSVQCLANSLASSVILSLASANALAHAISSRFVPFPPRISSLGYRGQIDDRIRKLNLIRSPQVGHQVGNLLGRCNDLVVRVVPLLHLHKEGHNDPQGKRMLHIVRKKKRMPQRKIYLLIKSVCRHVYRSVGSRLRCEDPVLVVRVW